MRQPPEFIPSIGGVVTLAALGVAVIGTMPPLAVVGWVLIGLAVLWLLTYVVWRLLAGPARATTAPLLVVSEEQWRGLLEVVREQGVVPVRSDGTSRDVTVEAGETLRIQDHVTAVVIRAAREPDGSVIVDPPSSRRVVEGVVNGMVARATVSARGEVNRPNDAVSPPAPRSLPESRRDQ